MGGEDELRLRLELANQLDHILIDCLIVEIIFRLINYDRDRCLADSARTESRPKRGLAKRVILQLLAVVLNREFVWYLISKQSIRFC